MLNTIPPYIKFFIFGYCLLVCNLHTEAKLVAGWDFSQIPASGDLTGFNGRISANYMGDFNFNTRVGSAAHPYGTLYFDGSHGSRSSNRIYRGNNLNANRGYPHRHTTYFGGGDEYEGYSATYLPFDDYAAQRDSGQAHAGPSSLAITRSTSITLGINETLFGYREEDSNHIIRMGTFYDIFSFGGKSTGGNTRITVQISHDEVFEEWDRNSGTFDTIGRTEILQDDEEKELSWGGLWAQLDYLNYLTGDGPDNPLCSPLYIRLNIELDMDTTFLLDNVQVTDEWHSIPEPADFALYGGLIALLCLLRRSIKQGKQSKQDALL